MFEQSQRRPLKPPWWQQQCHLLLLLVGKGGSRDFRCMFKLLMLPLFLESLPLGEC